MNDQAIRFRIGIFVLGALILLAVLIMMFGGIPTFFKPAETYTVRFTNVAGVTQGTPVRRAGVRIGEVRKLEFDDTLGKVNVLIQIEKGFSIRKNDQVLLGKGLFGTDVSIDFVPQLPEPGKVADTTPVEVGAILDGQLPTDPGAIVQKTSELVPEAKVMISDFRKVLQTIDKMSPLVEDTLREYREVGKAVRETMPELKRTTEEIREVAKASRQVVPDVRKTLEEFQVTARYWGKVSERADLLLATNEDKITRAIKSISDVFSEDNQRNFNNLLKNASQSSNRFDGIAKSTEEMILQTQKTVKRINESIMRTDEILANLQKATKPISERSPTIVKNMEESSDKLNLLLTDVRGLLRDFSQRDGTIQRFLSDPSLFQNLNETTCLVNRMLPRVEHILRDVEIFADKIARHPEALGVGGAVRPSNGLKEGPTIHHYRGPILP